MQKFYLTKCVLIGLSTTLASLSGMDIENAEQQEKTIIEYAQNNLKEAYNQLETALQKKHIDQLEAAQQERDIVLYVSTTAQINRLKPLHKFSNKNA